MSTDARTNDFNDVKRGKMKKDDVPIPMPEDYPERKKAGFKPEPLPNGFNIASVMAECRAKHAEACRDEMETIVSNYASTGMWPTKKLQVVYNHARDLRDTAVHFAVDAQYQFDKAQKAKAERLEEKKKALEALKTALNGAMMEGMHAQDYAKCEIAEKYAAGLILATETLKKWAPKIKAWPHNSIDKAVAVAQGVGIDFHKAQTIIFDAIVEDSEVNTLGKRVADIDDEEEEVENPVDTTSPAPKTPTKADKSASGSSSPSGASSAENSPSVAPAQTPKYRISKKAKAGADHE